MDPTGEAPKKINAEHLIACKELCRVSCKRKVLREGFVSPAGSWGFSNKPVCPVCWSVALSLTDQPTGRKELASVDGSWFLYLFCWCSYITFPTAIWACIKVVREYERAVVFWLGRILSKKANGPGLILILPCTDTFIKVDLRTVTCSIPPQEILTKDAVTTQVDGVVYYRIHSAVSAVVNVNNVHSATFLLAQTTLRTMLGMQTLAQLLAGRKEIAHSIQAILDSATEQWGIKVARVEIKDVRIPVAMQRVMAAEAEAM